MGSAWSTEDSLLFEDGINEAKDRKEECSRQSMRETCSMTKAAMIYGGGMQSMRETCSTTSSALYEGWSNQTICVTGSSMSNDDTADDGMQSMRETCRMTTNHAADGHGEQQ